MLSTGSLSDVPQANSYSGFGQDMGQPGDADLLGAAVAGFGGNAYATYDAAYLEFEFTVDDADKNAITFEVVFASEEYPEYASSFVDIAGVIVDGVNFALFDNDIVRPLSVTQANIDSGHFFDNQNSALPIEFDGVSYRLKIFAPLPALAEGMTTHRIKIGIADTNDGVLDSAMFVSGLKAVQYSGNGNIVSQIIDTSFGSKQIASFVSDQKQSEAFFAADAELAQDELDKLLKKLGIDAVELQELKTLLNQANVYESQQSKAEKVSLFGGDDIALLGSGTSTAYGGEGNDSLQGEAGNDKLYGGAGDDQLYGGEGNDQLYGEAGSDRLDGGAGNDKLLGGDDDDDLQGGAGNDQLFGGAGIDILDGGTGNDKLDGGADNDVYFVDSNKDVIKELAGGGIDSVLSFTSYTLGKEVENLYGMDNDDAAPGSVTILVGNALDNTIFGTSGSDQIKGGQGADILAGSWELADGLIVSAADGEADSFVYDGKLGSEGIDTLYFEFGIDQLRFSKKLIKSVPQAATEEILALAGDATANTRFVYDEVDGTLSYDADGSGNASAVALLQIVGLNDGTLSLGDFAFV